MTGTTWILVCDAGRARLFRGTGRQGELRLEREMDNPGGRAHGRELRPRITPDEAPAELEAAKFARTLAALLAQEVAAHALEALVLVAPPAFLGLLSASVSHQVAKRVAVRVDKDYTRLDARDLGRRLASVLGPPGVLPRA